MRFWLKRRDKIVHSYSLVGYLLSPNQTIMNHAYENRSLIHHKAVVDLIRKLIVDPKLVGDEKARNLAESINTFWDEYHLFVNKQKMFKFDHMWEPAARGDRVPAYRWHQRWSLHTTKVLGKLACIVESKILGIGTAERNWKQVKLMKSGQRSNIQSEKCKKQVTLYGNYQQVKARAKAETLSSAGKLWEDADFKSLKMDEYCKDMVEALDANARPTKMFRNWQETWERKPVGANGDVLLLERLQLKYIGFKLDENEGDHRVFTVHAIELKKEPRRKFYQLVAVTKEFDKSLSFEDNDLMHYDVWDFCGETYDCFRVYYDEYADDDGVNVYEKGGVCDSEDKGDVED